MQGPITMQEGPFGCIICRDVLTNHDDHAPIGNSTARRTRTICTVSGRNSVELRGSVQVGDGQTLSKSVRLTTKSESLEGHRFSRTSQPMLAYRSGGEVQGTSLLCEATECVSETLGRKSDWEEDESGEQEENEGLPGRVRHLRLLLPVLLELSTFNVSHRTTGYGC